MNLDKYRRIPSSPIEPAPALAGPGEALRQKANRYHAFIQDNESGGHSIPANVPEPPSQAPDAVEAESIVKQVPVTKGNKFKSNKRLLPSPKASMKQEPSSPGVKIVFLDDTMRKQYIQIAGYVMLNHGVKLTMTAYFCFLHEQAVAQQSDETFLTALTQFAQPRC